MNLLEKANIITTATAYDNGKLHSVKGGEVADFDVVRGSAATRVNSQGLVQNVQILSSNLVQNGDFSEEGSEEVSNGSFSQQGSELITNGDFSSDTAWVKGTGTTISGGSANFVNADGVSLYQSIGTQSGFVKITFNVTDYTSGTLNVYSGGNQSVGSINVSANALGTYTAYVDRNGGNRNIIFGSSDNFTGSIDNVSVREVAQNWSLGANWSVGENKVTSNASGLLQQSTSELTVGKTYKTSFEITEYTSGGVKLYSGSGSDTPSYQTSLGTHVVYFVANGNTTSLYSNNFNGSITNISVKEVGQNWALVGDFEVNNQEAFITNASQYSQLTNQIGVNYLLSGKKYKLEADIGELSISGSLAYRYTGGAVTRIYTTDIIDGKYTAYFTMPQNGNFWFQTTGSYTGLNATITNISVIEITDDTNLPRINYENFSYQDALGSELVLNGGFDTNLNNWIAYSNTLISWETVEAMLYLIVIIIIGVKLDK